MGYSKGSKVKKTAVRQCVFRCFYVAVYFVKVRERMKIVYKKILFVVSVALTVFLLNFIGSKYEVKANGVRPDFSAVIKCYGNFYGWDADTPTDMTASVHVSDYGEYSVSFAAPTTIEDLNEMSGAFVVETDLRGEPTLYPFTLCAKTARIGNKIYDWSKAAAFLDGDNIRMSIRNEWGSGENANPLAGWVIPVDKGDIMTFTFEVKEGTPAAAVPTEAPVEAPAKYYNAYLGFQVAGTWDYRNAYEEDVNSTDYNFITQARIGGEATDVNKVKIKNATITGDGIYSVSMTGADLSGGSAFNMLYISTNIPVRANDVTFSDIKVIIDGKEVTTLKEGIVKKEVQDGSRKYYMIMAVNVYGTSGVDLPEVFQYKMPKNSVELQFRIDFKGNYFNKDDVQNGKKEQVIHAKSYTKTYGSKKFSLNAVTSGDGKLSYAVANKKVATVSSAGKVAIKGYGKTIVTIKAAETSEYKSAAKKITITVIPKTPEFVVMSSPAKRQVACIWTEGKNVTGYQLKMARDKNFKKGIILRKADRKTSSIKFPFKFFDKVKVYYAKVRSYKKVGSKIYYSNWSKTKKAKKK